MAVACWSTGSAGLPPRLHEQRRVRGRLRASHADREQVIDTLKDAFVHGRLTKDEFDARVGSYPVYRSAATIAPIPWRHTQPASVKPASRSAAVCQARGGGNSGGGGSPPHRLLRSAARGGGHGTVAAAPPPPPP